MVANYSLILIHLINHVNYQVNCLNHDFIVQDQNYFFDKKGLLIKDFL